MRMHFPRHAAPFLVSLLIAALPALPALAAEPERTGEQIVRQQCSKCHETGEHGAPRIDDRAAWVPRMRQGLDATVRSAIRGHGAMPARGGLPDLTDTELRAAILYMFYPAGSMARPAPPSAPAAEGANARLIGNMEIHLGIMLADAIRTQEKKPSGRDQFHVNVTLRDHTTREAVTGARVEARVSSPVAGTQTRELRPLAREGDLAGSYGNYFRMTGAEPYTITVKVRPPKGGQPVEARFNFKR